jgi:hypothetical protein
MSIQKAEIVVPYLLVEGKDDQYVVNAICNRYNLPKNFEVWQCDGIDNLLRQIPIRIKVREERLGIIIDTDVDLAGRWKQLVNLLSPFGYQISVQPDSNGSILSSNISPCVVGIWLMPDNRTSGMIEDFARILIPEGDLLRSYAEGILSDIGSAGMPTSKMFIAPSVDTYLARLARNARSTDGAGNHKVLSRSQPRIVPQLRKMA